MKRELVKIRTIPHEEIIQPFSFRQLPNQIVYGPQTRQVRPTHVDELALHVWDFDTVSLSHELQDILTNDSHARVLAQPVVNNSLHIAGLHVSPYRLLIAYEHEWTTRVEGARPSTLLTASQESALLLHDFAPKYLARCPIFRYNRSV